MPRPRGLWSCRGMGSVSVLMVTLLVVLTGCTYQAAVNSLPVAERSEFRAYSKVMTPGQVRAYLAKMTPAERQAYLRDIGIIQRFQALDADDQRAVLAGQVKPGVSADALYFIWGEPYYWEGRRGHYERWFYRGSSFSLASTGDQHRNLGSQVEVYLVDGRVTAWNDVIPSTNDDSGRDTQWP
jgi:hypothetical protein